MSVERRAKTLLFVFAHQDDEIFFLNRIARELLHGHAVHCAYLTDGAGRGTDPSVRDTESRRVLARLGLPESRLHFLGSQRRVPDGRLVEHLEASLEHLCERFAGERLGRLYTLAWEGGHPDHDAAHVVALALAARRGLLRRTWQMPAYNGWRTPWKLFRVYRPLALPLRRLDARLSLRDALHQLWIARYPSQLRSYLATLPEHLVRRVIQRREFLLAVSTELVRARPHPGALLYERLYGLPYERFAAAAAPFIAEHLSG